MYILDVIIIYIQSECRKMQTRITPNTDAFYVVYVVTVTKDLLKATMIIYNHC